MRTNRLSGVLLDILRQVSSELLGKTLDIWNSSADCDGVFFAFAGEKLPLLTLKLNKSSLEEIFLELTQEGNSSKFKKGDKRQ